MNTAWIEVLVETSLDAGELLGMLNDPYVAGGWQENGTIRLYWSAAQWGAEVQDRLEGCLRKQPGRVPAIATRTIPDQDWNGVWAQSVQPFRVGRRFVIRPSWKSAETAATDIELIIDQKQAFGTGHHATTQLLLESLEDVIRGGERVLDIGTGSGILAMAALRLGAARAVGIDHDPVAIVCALESAQANQFSDELELRTATLVELNQQERHQCNLVLANLDRRTILDSLRELSLLLQGGARLLLSGLLVEDRAEIADAFGGIGAVVHASRERDSWVALEIGQVTADRLFAPVAMRGATGTRTS
jgi:ribosomal protein L11 methyltransferase